MKKIIIGLGNPILGDDSVGFHVTQQVEKRLNCEDKVEIDYLSLGGLCIMERLVGYDYAILVDSINSKTLPIGTILSASLDQLPNPMIGHLNSSHDTSVQNALQIGRSIGAQLPKHITIVGIEINPKYEFSEELTPLVAKSVPNMVNLILELINY